MASSKTRDRAAALLAVVRAHPRFAALAAWVLVFAALLLLYAPALHGQFLWDDNDNVTPLGLRSWDGLPRIWFQWGATQTYYPVLHTLYWIEQKLWGDATLGYHVASILFHSISVCLVYWIVRRLKIPGALLAAAIFTVHPVYAESIAWITEQKNTLSGMFTLASLLAYLHFDDSRRKGAYAWALVLFLLALESKPTAVTLPLALLVILWWKRGALSWRRDLAPLVPWFALSLLVGAFTVWYERVYVGVHGSDFVMAPLERCLLASRAVWFYLGKLFWPTNLILFYPRWEVNSAQAWQYLYAAGLLAIFAAAFAVRARWRGPLAALLVFVVTLFPLLGFFSTYIFLFTFVCDHFQYLPSLGIVVFAAGGIGLLLQRLSTVANYAGQATAALLVCGLAFLTWRQSAMYADAVTLYQTTIARNPTSWVAYNNLGAVLVAEGRTTEAMEYCQQALQLKPDFAAAHINLGNALLDAGHPQEAIEHLQQALRLEPDSSEAHNNLGNTLLRVGQPLEAIEQFQEAVRLNPNYPEAFNNLGIVLGRLGRIPEALAQFQQALALNPNYAEAHSDMGLALFKVDRTTEAIDHYETALRLKPNYAEAHAGLAAALAHDGRYPEAVEHYQQALKIKPQFSEACAHLAEVYAQLQKPTEAVAAARQAIELARSQGQVALDSQIQAWLDAYLAQNKARDGRD